MRGIFEVMMRMVGAVWIGAVLLFVGKVLIDTIRGLKDYK